MSSRKGTYLVCLQVRLQNHASVGTCAGKVKGTSSVTGTGTGTVTGTATSSEPSSDDVHMHNKRKEVDKEHGLSTVTGKKQRVQVQ